MSEYGNNAAPAVSAHGGNAKPFDRTARRRDFIPQLGDHGIDQRGAVADGRFSVARLLQSVSESSRILPRTVPANWKCDFRASYPTYEAPPALQVLNSKKPVQSPRNTKTRARLTECPIAG